MSISAEDLLTLSKAQSQSQRLLSSILEQHSKEIAHSKDLIKGILQTSQEQSEIWTLLMNKITQLEVQQSQQNALINSTIDLLTRTSDRVVLLEQRPSLTRAQSSPQPTCERCGQTGLHLH